MNDLVREWIEKAEGDYRVALRESQVTDEPSWDAAFLGCRRSWRLKSRQHKAKSTCVDWD